MYLEIVPRALQAYELDYLKVLPVQKGYRNESYPVVLTDSRTLNLIFYKSEPQILERIKAADKVSEFLAKANFPTRQRKDPRLLKLSSDTGTTYAGLYNYLPGQTIAWEAYGKDHIKLLGQTMSDMHALLVTMSPDSIQKVVSEYTAIAKRMTNYFAEAGVASAMKLKLGLQINQSEIERTIKLMKACNKLRHQQVLHMDFVRGNILFDNLKSKTIISGVLDFEKTAVGHPLFDIARTLAFLLVDCKYKSPQKVYKYFLYSGYAKRGKSKFPKVIIKAKDTNYELLEVLVGFFILHDFYKFLRHNPYEFLHQNQHYMRTQAALQQRNMLKYTR